MTEEVCTWKNLKQTYICYIQFTTDTVKEGFKLFRKYHLHLHSSKMRRNKKGDVQTLWQNVTSKVLATVVFILVANPLGVEEKAQGMQPFTFMLTTSYPFSSSFPIPICRFFGQNVNPKSFSILTNEDHQSRVSSSVLEPHYVT